MLDAIDVQFTKRFDQRSFATLNKLKRVEVSRKVEEVGGRVGRPLIERLEIRFLAPQIHILKCPWVRYRTPSHVCVCVCVWLIFTCIVKRFKWLED